MIGLFTKHIQTKNLKIMFNMYFLVTGFFLLSFALAVLCILQQIIIIILICLTFGTQIVSALSSSTLIPNSGCLLYIKKIKVKVIANNNLKRTIQYLVWIVAPSLLHLEVCQSEIERTKYLYACKETWHIALLHDYQNKTRAIRVYKI